MLLKNYNKSKHADHFHDRMFELFSFDILLDTHLKPHLLSYKPFECPPDHSEIEGNALSHIFKDVFRTVRFTKDDLEMRKLHGKSHRLTDPEDIAEEAEYRAKKAAHERNDCGEFNRILPDVEFSEYHSLLKASQSAYKDAEESLCETKESKTHRDQLEHSSGKKQSKKVKLLKKEIALRSN